MDNETRQSHLNLYEDPLRISSNNINYPQDLTHYTLAYESDTISETDSKDDRKFITQYYSFEYASPQPAPIIALDIIQFSKTFDQNDRCLYEVIPPFWNRFFHIHLEGDIMEDPLDLITSVCDAIIAFLTENNIFEPHHKFVESGNKKDLFSVFSSSTSTKLCYDIHLKHFYLKNFLATKIMYEKIVHHIPSEYDSYLQHKSYPPILLSLLCYAVPRSNEIYAQKCLQYNSSETLDTVSIMQQSLLGLVDVSVCTLINIVTPLITNQPVTWNSISPTAKLAFDLFNQYLEIHKLTPSFLFHSQRANLIKLRRIQPSECLICKIIHDKANAYLYIYTYCGDSIYFKCYECKTRHRPVFIGALHPDEHNRPDLAFDVNSTPNETYESEYVRPISESLLKHKTLLLRSPMGTGKTRAIIQHIAEYNHPRILVISCRQLFAQTCVNEYNVNLPSDHCQFRNYLDYPTKKYLGDIARLCVQVESLHRLLDILRNISNYDLIILDEFESSRTQFASNETLHNPVMVCKVFHMLMKLTPLVIVTDAFLSACGVTLMNLLRGRIYVIHNTIEPPPKLAIRKEY